MNAPSNGISAAEVLFGMSGDSLWLAGCGLLDNLKEIGGLRMLVGTTIPLMFICGARWLCCGMQFRTLNSAHGRLESLGRKPRHAYGNLPRMEWRHTGQRWRPWPVLTIFWQWLSCDICLYSQGSLSASLDAVVFRFLTCLRWIFKRPHRGRHSLPSITNT